MALNFAGLPELVRWLAEKHHHGAIYPMAEKIGLSSATMDKWAKGTVKNPELESLKLMAEAYRLDFSDVIEVATRRPSRRRRNRVLACLVGALGVGWLATAHGVRAEAATLAGLNVCQSSLLSEARRLWVVFTRQYHHWWGKTFPTQRPLGRRVFPDLRACLVS